MLSKKCPVCGGNLLLKDGVYSHCYSVWRLLGKRMLGKKVCDYTEKLVKKERKGKKKLGKKMTIRIRKVVYNRKGGGISVYYYKEAYRRVGGKVKFIKYLGKVKNESKNKREAKD